MGFTPTIMDYGILNYVAQPADKLPARDLVKQLGPYDRWAIAWLYQPIPGAYTLEAEKPTLAQWLTAQDTTPYLRGVEEKPNEAGPTDVGADQLLAAEYRIQDLARLAIAFDLRRSDVLWSWIKALKEASHLGAAISDADSAYVVATVHFYLEHVVLGHDPLLQARHITWAAVPPGWNLARWQRRQTTLLESIVQLLQALVAPDSSQEPGVRVGVCQELTTTVTALGKTEPGMSDAVVRMHTDSVRTQLAAIATKAACPRPSP
jgi:hypothetical protein